MGTEMLDGQRHRAWRAMGDHGFGVREVPGSNPGLGGTPIFDGVSFK